MLKQLIFSLLVISFSSTSFALDFDYTINSNLKGKLRSNIEEALVKVSSIVSKDEFWQKANNIDSFECLTSDTPSINEIRDMKINFKLKAYWYPKKSVKAKTVGSIISINKKAGPRNVKSLSNTIFHEVMHVAGISHCGVNNIKKYPHIKKSIPYVLGSLLENEIQ